MHWHRTRLDALLEEEQTEIVADYRATCERARRFATERLRLHRMKRRQLLSLLGLFSAGAAPGRLAPTGCVPAECASPKSMRGDGGRDGGQE
jgi:hypothetical protein